MMKKYFIPFFAVVLFNTPTALDAQAKPDLEFNNQSATGSGPVLSTPAFTFFRNTDNPTGNTFATFSPVVTATFSVSNPQYTGSGTYNVNGVSNPTAFGAHGNGSGTVSDNISVPIGYIGGDVANSYFTSTNAPTGTGISTTNNYGVILSPSTGALDANALPTTGTYYLNDLVINFNSPVTNPSLHFASIGSVVSNAFGTNLLGISSQFELVEINGAAANANVLSKVSGNNTFAVANNKVYNNAATNTSSNDAAGSTLVNATGIRSLRFKVYMKGDRSTATGNWSVSNGTSTTDAVLLSVSLPVGFTAINDTFNLNAGTNSFTTVLANDSNTNGVMPTIGTGSGQVQLTQTSTSNSGVNIDPNSGSVVVASGTAPGTYTLSYRICEQPALTICSSATVTVIVGEPNAYSCPSPMQSSLWGSVVDGSSTATASAQSIIGSGASAITVTMSSPGADRTDVNFQSESGLATGNGYFSATSNTGNTSPQSGTGYLFSTPDLVFDNALKAEFIWDTAPVTSAQAGSYHRTINFTFSKPVSNVVLHVDRLGGYYVNSGGTYYPNSGTFTVTTPNVTMRKLSGNSVLNVTSTQFNRNVDGNSIPGPITEINSNPPAAAGSILVTSPTPFTTLSFDFTGTGYNGTVAGDGIELILETCATSVCYKPATTSGTPLDTKHGITSLQRAGASAPNNWPIVRKGGYTALEANTKGFVVNRLTTTQINKIVSDGKAVEGMAVYDVTVNCFKIYDGTAFKCYTTPSCDQ